MRQGSINKQETPQKQADSWGKLKSLIAKGKRSA
jgi:hypothetical protein